MRIEREARQRLAAEAAAEVAAVEAEAAAEEAREDEGAEEEEWGSAEEEEPFAEIKNFALSVAVVGLPLRSHAQCLCILPACLAFGACWFGIILNQRRFKTPASHHVGNLLLCVCSLQVNIAQQL